MEKERCATIPLALYSSTLKNQNKIKQPSYLTYFMCKMNTRLCSKLNKNVVFLINFGIVSSYQDVWLINVTKLL